MYRQENTDLAMYTHHAYISEFLYTGHYVDVMNTDGKVMVKPPK